MMTVIDIETIPVPEAERLFAKPEESTVKLGNTKDPDKRAAKVAGAVAAWEESCALHAHVGRVALVCISDGDRPTQAVHDDDERVLLENVFATIGNLAIDGDYTSMAHPILVGHNIRKFDAPFLVRRALILGVPVPGWIITDLRKYRGEWKPYSAWKCSPKAVTP